VTLTEGALALLGRSDSDVREAQVDPSRIAALRLAIENGTHEINADRIAERLMRMEQDL
jgi:anti-sigma28 factor (negative regulator of flagellin synthesis)